MHNQYSTRNYTHVKLPTIVTQPVYTQFTPKDMTQRGPNRGGSVSTPKQTARELNSEEIC